MKLKNIILLGVATVALTACDDLFEPALENSQDITLMDKDPEVARGIIDNAFLVIPIEANGIASESNGGCLDVATDDAVSNNNNNNYRKMAMGAWTASFNPVNQWEARYHAIQYCNLFLSRCDNVLWDYSSASLNKMHLDLYKGNAYALRGLHFFHLLRAHCGTVGGKVMGVAIHTTPEDGSSDFNQPRDNFKECIDSIMSDFDKALQYVPVEYGNVKSGGVPAKYKGIVGADGQVYDGTEEEYNRAFGDLQRGKIDGRMIAAFKAQVALFAASPAYQQAGAMTWEDAAKYAVEALKHAGGLAGMDPDGWHWFDNAAVIDNYKFTDPDPAEICWRGNVGKSTTLEADHFPPSLSGNGRLNPSQNLVDAFPMANGYPISDALSGYNPANPYANRDPRLHAYIVCNGDVIGANGTAINTAADNTETLDGLNRENGKSTKTGYYLRKHLRPDVNLNPTTDQVHFGARIRYTEIFLAYAEAANEAAGPKANVGGASYSAYDVIKALRRRAGVGVNGDPYLEACAGSKEKMRELIRNERRLELCFEGHRFWDLRRWNVDLAQLNATAKGMSITTNGNTGALDYRVLDVESRSYKNYMYYGPIPWSELMKWSALQQNDGWETPSSGSAEVVPETPQE